MELGIIGQPLFEAAAQTMVGALVGYTFDKLIEQFYRENTYNGAFDLWQRGIHGHNVQSGDTVHFDGLISPYVQLFPRDPYTNALRWNELHNYSGSISANEFCQMEFYAGSDEAIRTGPLNGETLVGLYNRYGYIGEGILGVVSTSLLRRKLPDFFSPSYWGCHVRVSGTLSYCPAQHGYIAQGIFMKAGISSTTENYKEIPYLKINSIRLYNRERDRTASLLGSPWAATSEKEAPYILQYGYFSELSEVQACNRNIKNNSSWDAVKVFYDTLTAPNPSISFSNTFIS